MKQVVQPVAGGSVRVVDVPRPTITPTQVLVRTVASVVSPGTERAVTELAQSSLLAKARSRPDLVRQVIDRTRRDGLVATARKVRQQLGGDVPLGYSAAGIVVEVGEAVDGVRPGLLVATAGAGHANHAEFQAVAGLLCAPVPVGVDAEEAAFATLASVALHGIRLAEVGPGAKVLVVGLGLIGQLAVRILRASGCDVAGTDVSEFPVGVAAAAGATAFVDVGETTTDALRAWSRGRGADAVLLAAATPSSEAIMRTADRCRDRATVVVVGDVGLHLERRPFYERELTLRFARSYGPGRYERAYEEWAVDYPAGQLRWTEGRNLEAVLDLLAGGQLVVRDLITHRYPIDDAAQAYEQVEGRGEPSLGIVLTYAGTGVEEGTDAVRVHAPRRSTQPGIGLIGAGAFASTVLVPSLADAGLNRFVAVTSATGLSALRLAERAGFERAASGPDAVIDAPDVDVVVIATPHDSHADLAARALRAGKHVWCEKPLALTPDELDHVEAAARASDAVLFVGFNRRYAPATAAIREIFAPRSGPLAISYRINAGPIGAGHWYADRRQGGRLLGEACHFVDACSAIAGDDPTAGFALAGPAGESLLADQFILGIRFGDGSLATIAYASGGPPRGPKERVEIFGGGKAVTVTDFGSVEVHGERPRTFRDVKGHRAAARRFAGAVRGADQVPAPFAVHRALFEAVGRSSGSVPVDNGAFRERTPGPS